MKAFRFRLEQALRWRETQRSAQQARVAAAASRKGEIERVLEATRRDMDRDALAAREYATGESLTGYGARLARTQRQLEELSVRQRDAVRALDEEIGLWVEMNRRVRLLELMRESGQTAWRAEFERELDGFAAESFLGRWNRR